MSDDHTLRVQRDYAVDAETVFDGFVGVYDYPRPDWVLEARCDLRVGGAWELVFSPPGVATFSEYRTFAAIDRPHRLAYQARISQPGAEEFETAVEVSIDDVAGSTRLTLTQSGFPAAATRDDFAAAWPDVLALIAGRIEPAR